MAARVAASVAAPVAPCVAAPVAASMAACVPSLVASRVAASVASLVAASMAARVEPCVAATVEETVAACVAATRRICRGRGSSYDPRITDDAIAHARRADATMFSSVRVPPNSSWCRSGCPRNHHTTDAIVLVIAPAIGDGTKISLGGGSRPAARYIPRIAMRICSRSKSVCGSVLRALAIHCSAHGCSCALCSSVRMYFSFMWSSLSLVHAVFIARTHEVRDSVFQRISFVRIRLIMRVSPRKRVQL